MGVPTEYQGFDEALKEAAALRDGKPTKDETPEELVTRLAALRAEYERIDKKCEKVVEEVDAKLKARDVALATRIGIEVGRYAKMIVINGTKLKADDPAVYGRITDVTGGSYVHDADNYDKKVRVCSEYTATVTFQLLNSDGSLKRERGGRNKRETKPMLAYYTVNMAKHVTGESKGPSIGTEQWKFCDAETVKKLTDSEVLRRKKEALKKIESMDLTEIQHVLDAMNDLEKVAEKVGNYVRKDA